MQDSNALYDIHFSKTNWIPISHKLSAVALQCPWYYRTSNTTAVMRPHVHQSHSAKQNIINSSKELEIVKKSCLIFTKCVKLQPIPPSSPLHPFCYLPGQNFYGPCLGRRPLYCWSVSPHHVMESMTISLDAEVRCGDVFSGLMFLLPERHLLLFKQQWNTSVN